jgi:hypothetical protein
VGEDVESGIIRLNLSIMPMIQMYALICITGEVLNPILMNTVTGNFVKILFVVWRIDLSNWLQINAWENLIRFDEFPQSLDVEQWRERMNANGLYNYNENLLNRIFIDYSLNFNH